MLKIRISCPNIVKMKVSIITISFNSGKTIEATIRSVLAQEDADIEYIIIDGGSKDNTLQIVEKFKHRIAHVVSEKDNGIYDAMNKGLANYSGDAVGFLNSDDAYRDSSVLSRISDALGGGRRLPAGQKREKL